MDTVRCRTGIYKGKVDDKGVAAFLGIRYAMPPVGENRWKPPVPVPEIKASDETITEAFEYGNVPVQKLNLVTSYSSAARVLMKRTDKNFDIPEEYSEDCLFLNIWASDDGRANKPVLVWIYGGAYIQGDSGSIETCGSRLVNEYKDIIVVSLEYRLGVLGSINLSGLDKEGAFSYSHNLSIMDQQLALRWIHDNIEAFGGNPDNITICGHSAGSNAVTQHLTSEISRQYFAKAIGQSSFMPGAGITSMEDSRTIGDEFIRISGAKSMQELLELPASDLLRMQSELMQSDFATVKSKLFSPVADGKVLPLDGFKRLAEGAAADKKVIIGCSAGEMDTMFEGKDDLNEIREMILKRCKAIGSEASLTKIEQKMSSQKYPSRTERECLIDIYNDINIRLPGLLTAKALSKKGCCYVYYFDYWFDDDVLRAPHGVINTLLFDYWLGDLLPKEIGKNVRDTWISFVREGDPNNAMIPQWKPYTEAEPETMIINSTWAASKAWKLTDEKTMLPLFDETAIL